MRARICQSRYRGRCLAHAISSLSDGCSLVVRESPISLIPVSGTAAGCTVDAPNPMSSSGERRLSGTARGTYGLPGLTVVKVGPSFAFGSTNSIRILVGALSVS